MGRLIDADKLKEALHEDCMTAMGTIDENTLNLLMIEIDEILTAYDVDKVIEVIEEYWHRLNTDNEDAVYTVIEDVIEIVKGGCQG